MEVVLAGYNVDAQVLGDAAGAGVPADRLTPEMLSAAYARISRDPRPVGELRRVALAEKRAPLSSLLLSGKDRFVERYEKVFGRRPRVDPATLGG